MVFKPTISYVRDRGASTALGRHRYKDPNICFSDLPDSMKFCRSLQNASS